FIGHFLREYSSHFADRQGMFESVTARAPYYMALNLLRIARNDYIDRDYGGRLTSQAKRLLRAALAAAGSGGRLASGPFGQYACMDIRAVAFDANGTLVKILTEDGMEEIFRAAAHFLTYQGINLCRDQVRDLYFAIMAEQQQASPEEHPEFDAVGIWRRVIAEHQTAFTRALPAAKLEQMPLFLAEMCRGISRRRLGLYPHAREVQAQPTARD